MASALEMPIREEDESDARYARLSDPGEPSGLAALLCPCLRRAPAYERVEEETPNPLAAQPGDAARDDDPHRGSWLDEADELAASCFACSSAFHPASVEAAPRLGIELASVTAVEDKPDGFAIKYDAAAAH
ncbi:hypothetical protein JL720_17321 [Aureococcus anophagefferens]|nr:hypothetical protein JL720_17321 [Aureococcus anophagefferens]